MQKEATLSALLDSRKLRNLQNWSGKRKLPDAVRIVYFHASRDLIREYRVLGCVSTYIRRALATISSTNSGNAKASDCGTDSCQGLALFFIYAN